MNKKHNHWPLSILSAFSSILNLGLPIAMARLLPAPEIGLFRIFFVYLLVIPNISLSVGMMNGLYFWAGKGADGRRSMQGAGQLLYAAAFIISAVLLFFHSAIAQALGVSTWVAILFAVAAVPTILHIHFESALIATGEVWKGAVFSSFFEFFRAAAMLYAVIKIKNYVAVIEVHLVILLLKLFLGTIFSWKKAFLAIRWQKENFISVIQYAAPVSFAALFDMFLTNSDRFLVSHFINPEEFAVYMMGCLAVPPLLVFEQSVNKVLIPQMSEALHLRRNNRAAELLHFTIDELLMILLPACVGLIVFSKPIVSLLFTEKYSSAASYLVIYAFNYLLLGIPYDVYFRASGQARWILKNAIQFGTLSLVAGIVASYFFGAMGALLSMLMVQFCMRIRAILLAKKSLAVKTSELFPLPALVKYASLSLLLALLSLVAKKYFLSERTWFFVCGSIFTILYFLLEASKVKQLWFFLKKRNL